MQYLFQERRVGLLPICWQLVPWKPQMDLDPADNLHSFFYKNKFYENNEAQNWWNLRIF